MRAPLSPASRLAPRAAAWLLVALALVVALVRPLPAGEEDREAPLRLRGDPLVGLGPVDPFADGILDAGRLAALSGLGSTLVLIGPVPWGRIEPRPPIGGERHIYDFARLDAVVCAWVEAGFEPVLVLSCASPWASRPSGEGGFAQAVRVGLGGEDAPGLLAEARGARPPADGHWHHWEAFVEAVLERYDGDEHRPNGPLPLALPVRWVQIHERPGDPRDFCGDAVDHLRLLHHAGQAAERAARVGGPLRVANAEGDGPLPVRLGVVHGAVEFGGLGRPPLPDEDVFRERLERDVAALPASAAFLKRWHVEFALRTLEMPRLVDSIAVRSTPHVLDDEVEVRWTRHLLDLRGADSKVLWLQHAALARLEPPRHGVGPSSEEARLRSRWAAAARDPSHADHAVARAWRERGSAYDIVRTLATARAAGARRVLWADGGGELVLCETQDQATWRRLPAWHALAQAQRLLAGRPDAARLPAGNPLEAVVFKAKAESRLAPVTVLFLAPDLSWAGPPEGPPPEREVTVPLADGTWVIEEIQLADGEPVQRTVEVTGGVLRLVLTPAPVYVRR